MYVALSLNLSGAISTNMFFTPPVFAAAKNSFQSMIPWPTGTSFLSAVQSDKCAEINLPGYLVK